MDLRELRDDAQKAALRAGPGLFKIFVIYALVMSVLNFVIYLLQEPFYEWQQVCMQFVTAGDFLLPEPGRRVTAGLLLALVLALLGKVVTEGWISVMLHGARGGEYSWHDLWAFFGNFWKVFVISILTSVLCSLACCLLIFPGVILFYKWRLSLYVLAEHPDYGPIQCMKQSRRLMEGEKANLLRVDVSCWLLFGLAGIVWYVTSDILPLWRMPSIMIIYAAFYNRMVYWKAPEDEKLPPTP